MKKLVGMLVVIFLTLILVACGGGGSDSKTTVEQPSETGVVTGVVTKANGLFLADVNVTISKQTVQTDLYGVFLLSNIPKNESLVINFTKEGYISTSEVETIDAKETRYLEVRMKEQSLVQTFPATVDANITFAEGSVAIEKDSIVDSSGNPYYGTVYTAPTYFDPTTDEGLSAFPGDFVGIDTNGNITPIISYGYVDISLSDYEGKKLQIATGKTAELTIPIPISQQATAPDTMPRWYFNQNDGQWHEEGIGILNASRTAYVGDVSHFSIWNNDIRYDSSTVSGKIVDCLSLEPIKYAKVTAKGIYPSVGWKSVIKSTPSSGIFSNLVVAPNSLFEIYAEVYVNGRKRSITKTYTSAPSGQNLEIDNICIQTKNPIFTSSSSASVNENQISAITLIATNNNTSTIKYSIHSGDSADFNLNSTSGVITFKTAPDFETKQNYSFTARATDELGNTDTQSITITIVDVNEDLNSGPCPLSVNLSTDSRVKSVTNPYDSTNVGYFIYLSNGENSTRTCQYYPSGKLGADALGNKEGLNGLSLGYYESGVIRISVYYVNNLKHGEYKEYNELGELTDCANFQNDVFVGSCL